MLLPHLIRAVQPNMRVIVLLRDPVARMYSAFWYYGCLYNVYKDYGMSPKGFDRLAKVLSCSAGSQHWVSAQRCLSAAAAAAAITIGPLS